VTKFTVAGIGVGALIPGVGPFISAATLLTTAPGAVAGAVVGGTTGAIASTLALATASMMPLIMAAQLKRAALWSSLTPPASTMLACATFCVNTVDKARA
jgi:hypothetical protein